ncbi:MAG: ribosomal L7Ae/L30e/S12e/Gadd45 family protein [Eubacteriales bacterium]|nr:ribosomal L7Ae/L30e/S12e/Gadd45 family protein [Eubacteriales bacterium]
MDKILSALGLCRKAGKLPFGTDAVLKEIRVKKARLVLIAFDSSDSTKKCITDKAVFYGVKYEIINYTRKELGSALGKPHCACAAICDDNLAEMYQMAKLKTAEVN